MWSRVLLRAAALIVPIFAASSAQATGSITCSIADRSLTLTFEGVTSQGLGDGLAQARGEVTPTLKLLSPGFGPAAFHREQVTQYWLDKSSLKLRIYVERPEDGRETLELVIEVRQEGRDPTAFTGTYRGRATHFDPAAGSEAKEAAFKGRIDCQVG